MFYLSLSAFSVRKGNVGDLNAGDLVEVYNGLRGKMEPWHLMEADRSQSHRKCRDMGSLSLQQKMLSTLVLFYSYTMILKFLKNCQTSLPAS